MSFENTNLDADTSSSHLKLVDSKVGLIADGLGKYINKKRVVRNVSFGVQRGEAIGLLGPNGAGKTTTFYLLCGLLAADEGRVFLDGLDITQTPMFYRARLGMGYLPPGIQCFPRDDSCPEYQSCIRNR